MKKNILILLLALLLVLSAGCGKSTPAEKPQPTAAATEQPAAEATAEPTAEPEPTADPDSMVAKPEDMIAQEEVLEEGMTGVFAESIKDGTYPVEMKSSSAMFRADHVELVVSGGEMEAVLYINSDSYGFLFPGTAHEAAASDKSAWVAGEKTDDGMYRFPLPIQALDQEVPCAAFSNRKQLWYDRNLLFRADSLPFEAFKDGAIPTAESLGLADGAYTVEVVLEGGSGRATVASPARLFVENGAATAEIVWSSSNFDYMRIGEDKFLPTSTEAGSTFMLPVAAFNLKLGVVADTTAMSQAHEIEYTLYFRADSIQPAE